MTHTKEPWNIESCEGTLWIGPSRPDGKVREIVFSLDLKGYKNTYVARQAANARRIVSCVNALAGKPDPAAYVAAMDACVEALAQIKKRADELRAGTDDWFELVEFGLCAGTALQSARAAKGDA